MWHLAVVTDENYDKF